MPGQPIVGELQTGNQAIMMNLVVCRLTYYACYISYVDTHVYKSIFTGTILWNIYNKYTVIVHHNSKTCSSFPTIIHLIMERLLPLPPPPTTSSDLL